MSVKILHAISHQILNYEWELGRKEEQSFAPSTQNISFIEALKIISLIKLNVCFVHSHADEWLQCILRNGKEKKKKDMYERREK